MRTFIAFTLASVLLLLPACKRQYQVKTSDPANAGLAEITLDRDKTGNGTIDLGVEHLTAPQDIDASLTSYVVWAQIAGSDPFKLGILDYDADKRSGQLSATYSAQEFTLMMTAEQDPNVATPLGTNVLQLVVVAPPE